MSTGELLIDPKEWSTQRWKNGGGITHEIWRWTDPKSGDLGPDAHDLRLSVAEIEGAGPFSRFPGHYRTLIALEDTLLELATADGKPRAMKKHHAFHFPGDVAAATLGRGHATDLNVISRLARRRAHVTVSKRELDPTSDIWPSTRLQHLAIFALSPTTLRNGGAARELTARQTLIQLDAANELAYEANVPVVWIRF
ncbi:MAG: HutD family protein [Polyangiaceae bacterium]